MKMIRRTNTLNAESFHGSNSLSWSKSSSESLFWSKAWAVSLPIFKMGKVFWSRM